MAILPALRSIFAALTAVFPQLALVRGDLRPGHDRQFAEERALAVERWVVVTSQQAAELRGDLGPALERPCFHPRIPPVVPSVAPIVAEIAPIVGTLVAGGLATARAHLPVASSDLRSIAGQLRAALP